MPRREFRRRRRFALASLVAVAVAVVLTVRASPVAITPPAVDAPDLVACTAIISRLPGTLDRAAARPVSPPSTLTAAWGWPAITLRCGTPGVPHPLSAEMVCLGGVEGSCTGGVDWYQDAFDETLWSTRVPPRLELHIPARDGLADVLGPITAAALARP